jgi:hypothetical protein
MTQFVLNLLQELNFSQDNLIKSLSNLNCPYSYPYLDFTEFVRNEEQYTQHILTIKNKTDQKTKYSSKYNSIPKMSNSEIFDKFKIFTNYLNEIIDRKYYDSQIIEIFRNEAMKSHLITYFDNITEKSRVADILFPLDNFDLIPYLPVDNKHFHLIYTKYLLEYSKLKNIDLHNLLYFLIKYNKIIPSDDLLIRLICCGDLFFFKQIKEKYDFVVEKTHIEHALIYGFHEMIAYLKSFKPKFEKDFNPFELLNINYKHPLIQVWNGYSWGNDECDKPEIEKSDCDYLKSFEECKHYGEFEIQYVKKWLENQICDEQIIFKYHNINLELNTKYDIKKSVEIIGKYNTWQILKKKGSNILDFILDS